MTSYPVQLWSEIELRSRNSTSSQTLPSWFGFTEWTVASTVWVGPQVPFRRAVESSYFLRVRLIPTNLGPKGEAGNCPNIGPVETVLLAIGPSAPFRNGILGANKVGAVGPVRFYARGSSGQHVHAERGRWPEPQRDYQRHYG
jgi:hypothetical protein